jgi:hypothetical protein
MLESLYTRILHARGSEMISGGRDNHAIKLLDPETPSTR